MLLGRRVGIVRHDRDRRGTKLLRAAQQSRERRGEVDLERGVANLARKGYLRRGWTLFGPGLAGRVDRVAMRYTTSATITADTPTIIHGTPFTPPHEETTDRAAPRGSEALAEFDSHAW